MNGSIQSESERKVFLNETRIQFHSFRIHSNDDSSPTSYSPSIIDHGSDDDDEQQSFRPTYIAGRGAGRGAGRRRVRGGPGERWLESCDTDGSATGRAKPGKRCPKIQETTHPSPCKVQQSHYHGNSRASPVLYFCATPPTITIPPFPVLYCRPYPFLNSQCQSGI